MALFVLALWLVLPTVAWGSVELLTGEERQWLDAHPIIRIAPDPEFPPIEYFDEQGVYRGIAADYVSLLEQKLNMKFQIVQLSDWSEVLQQARNRDVDMFGAAASTPQREEYMNFNTPHFELPGVIIVASRVDQRNISLNELKGLKVAVASGYVWQDFIERDYPAIVLEPVADVITGLKKVAFGSVDAMVANLAIATHYIEKEGITNLRVAGETGYYGRYAFGVRNDWPELSAILEKGLKSINEEERKAILGKWINLKSTSIFETRIFWVSTLTLFVIFIIILVFLWSRSLQRQVKVKTSELRNELTQRIQAQADYLASQRRYDTLLQSAYDAIFLLSDMKVVDSNKAAERMFKCDRSAFEKTPPYTLSPEKQPDGATSMEKAELLLQACLEGQPQWFEWQHQLHDGTLLDAEVTLTGFKTYNQQFVLAIVRDVSERKRIERLKDAFIATVSHEIRTPLTSIRGSLILINSGAVGKLEDQVEKLIGIAHSNTESLLDLVNDLLDIQKLESGKIELNLVDTNIEAFLKQALMENKSYGNQNHVVFNLIEMPESIFVSFDQKRIMQVMNNLLSNATKFSPENSTVDVWVEKLESCARIHVADRGPGVPASFQESLFDRFTQADVSTARKIRGTGLGLSISKMIVDLHGGNIAYKSREGGGSVFYFDLPFTSVVS